MKLSKHFSLEELTFSQTAARLGIDNTPSDEVLENLKHLCSYLEKIREYLGGLGIVVSSGYRCKELNVAIGGAKTSRHMTGLAVDFTVPRYGNPLTVAKAIRDSGIPYNQLIHEYGKWVHLEVIPVGMDEKDAKKQDLSIKKGTGYTKGLT